MDRVSCFMGISDTYTDDYFRHCFTTSSNIMLSIRIGKTGDITGINGNKLYKGNYDGGEIAYLKGNEDLNYHYRNDIPGFINTYSC